MTDPRFPKTPMNGCSACRKDFASLTAFDQHRVGKHDYDWSIDHEDGRRCLDVHELSDWLQDSRGRWTTTKLKARGVKLAEHHQRRVMNDSKTTEAA